MDAISAAALTEFVTIVGLGLLLAIGALCAVWATWLVVRRWGPRHVRGSITGFPFLAVGTPLLVIAIPVGCAWGVGHPAPPARERQNGRVSGGAAPNASGPRGTLGHAAT